MAENIVEIISKLGVDASGVFTELDKVNAKYKESTGEVRKQKDEIASLTKFEEGLQAQRAKTNNPTVQAQFTKEIEKTRAQIKALTAEVAQQTKGLVEENKEATKLKTNLDKAFDGTKAKSLKTQLRELKEQLAATDDDEEFLKLSIEAGRLEDKIQDAGTAARIFASESKFEVLGSALGNIGQKILALDFAGAAQGSQLLLKASQQITFKDAIAGIKQIGQTLFNVGRALLTNPLFLIGAAAALIIGNFDKISEAITGTERRVKELTRAYEAQKKASDLLVQAGERELKLAEAQGKSDEELLKLKRRILIAKIDDAKASIVFNNAKQQEVLFNDSLYESYLRLSAGASNFFGVTAVGQMQLLALDKNKRERNKEANEAQLEAEKNLLDLINQLSVDQAELNTKKGKEANEKAKKLEEERIATVKKIRDLEVSNITDETERAKAAAVAKYNDEFVLAKGNATLILELRRQLDNELAKIDKDASDRLQAAIDKEVQLREDANQKIVDAEKESKLKAQTGQEEELDEVQRHQTALLEIKLQEEKDANVILLANEINFERARLGQIAEFYGTQSKEFEAQANKLKELEAKLVSELNKIDKERVKQIVDNTKIIIDAVTDEAQKIIAAEIAKTDKLISLQQKRVDEVAKIAENGNAELLELEKERLDKLNKEKEKFVRQQQVLATIELIANTAVTVSKAAAEGGAGAAFTIAAALIALIGGLASARSIAGQAAFYEGGYTGDGNPREESRLIGRRPYIYHKGEFVHDHETTKKYRKIFQGVHEGKIDLNQMKFESDMYKVLSARGIDSSRETKYRDLPQNNIDFSELRSGLNEVKDAIKGQSRLKVNIDKNGIAIIATQYIKDRNRINTIAR